MKRILVFSVDAMIDTDIDYLMTKPNFQKYLAGGSRVKQIRTIYPSVTYPAHVSMMTGCYPEKTGVYTNCRFTTKSKDDTWQWFSDPVKVKDIFAAAKEKGYKTASIFWTTTGNNPNIDYNLTEYWLPEKTDTLRSSFARVGANEAVLQIVEKNKYLLPKGYEQTGRKNVMIHPEIDFFLVACACDIIKEYAPEVTFVHNGNMDGARHQNGAHADCLRQELDLVDNWIGDLGRALEAAGHLEDTDFFLVSDHGQRDIVRTTKPNYFFKERGYIDVDEKGRVKDYRAYCFSNAMSANVYLKDPTDRKLYEEVKAMLYEMRDTGLYGFSDVLTVEETKERYHLSGDFSFVLESDGYTSFSDSCKFPPIASFDLTDYRFGRATHGYMPEKGPQAVFVAKGPHIKEGVELDLRPIVDEAVTYARLLDVDLPDADGTAMEEILKL